MSPEPQGRFRIVAGLIPLVKEKIPFFACALVSALITLSVPPKVGALQTIVVQPVWLRIENAIVAYVTYLFNTLWPAGLTVFYPFPRSIPLWQVSGSLLVLLAITLTAVRAHRRHPYLIVGWFWYLVMLVPVLGLIPFGPHSMADRYTYLPLVGPFIALAWGVPAFTAKLPYQRTVLALLAAVAIVASIVLTSLQLRHWQSSIALFRHALEVSPANSLAHTNLAVALQEQGQLLEAVDHLHQAIAIDPQDILAHYNLGLIYLEQGHFDEAITEIFKSSAPGFDQVEVYLRLGNELYMQGRFRGAAKFYRKVLALQPDSLEARNNLGVSLYRQGNFADAIVEFEEILRKYPGHADARYNLELAREQQKRLVTAP
jgi:Flp pilus assembly protein TadD